MRINLLKFMLMCSHWVAVGVKDDETGACSAMVNGGDKVRHVEVCNVRRSDERVGIEQLENEPRIDEPST